MITPDPQYDRIEPLPAHPMQAQKRGIQCGECGMKFEYGVSYGYACGNPRCPCATRGY
jgi:hypothetical protein